MMTAAASCTPLVGSISIPAGNATLEGSLNVPANAKGVVVFAHGSGNSRNSPRNRFVADSIRSGGVGTLLFDLLTPEEARADAVTHALRFDVPFLKDRLVSAVKWLNEADTTSELSIGLFGASTGAAAALVAAAELGDRVAAVVSRGGRPDLADVVLPRVAAPTLLIVGSRDAAVITLNRQAFYALKCEKELAFVAGATHMFEEPGALDRVAELAAVWFGRHLNRTEPWRNHETKTRKDSRQAAAQ